MHDSYVNHELYLVPYEIEQRLLNFPSPKRLKNQGTLNCSSKVKVSYNAFLYQ